MGTLSKSGVASVQEVSCLYFLCIQFKDAIQVEESVPTLRSDNYFIHILHLKCRAEFESAEDFQITEFRLCLLLDYTLGIYARFTCWTFATRYAEQPEK